MFEDTAIGVVIPCYRVRSHILGVLSAIGPEVSRIYVVDDHCPEKSGDWVRGNCSDPRVTVIDHAKNQGVGGATITGMRRALDDGMTIIVKVDGDGQADPALIPALVAPILRGEADYTKGNRFYSLDGLKGMPPLRLAGNSALSFLTKLSTGYWNLMDPTNGLTALHANVARILPLDRIDKRYFFESDLLFRLNTVRAVVLDVPMHAKYGAEESGLNVIGAIPEFGYKHLRALAKRIVYSYFLRDFSVCSIQLVCGSILLLFGVIFGAIHWRLSVLTGVPSSTGTVMVSALPVVVGMELLLAAVMFDVSNVPRRPLHNRLPTGKSMSRPSPSQPDS